MTNKIVSLAVVGAFMALGSQAALAAPDWAKVGKSTIHVFHPGAAPFEWVQGKGEHSGASGLKKGESCAGCHVEDGKLSLDLKRLARALGAKKAGLVDPETAERLTGYHVGGISPFGVRQPLPVVMDAAVLSREAVLINAGRRGLMLRMSPLDIRAGLGCAVAEVSEA